MKTKSKIIQQRDDYFASRFNEFFKAWKEKDKKKNTQGEFARQICEIRKKKYKEKCPVTNSYVSEWSRGVWFPELYLPEIAEVLGVNESDFYFQRDDIYSLSSEYMTKLGKGEMSRYCEEVGLDLRFLHIVRDLMGPDFDRSFPTWTPLEMSHNIFDDKTYRRRPPEMWSESAEMDGTVRVLQYTLTYKEDGETKEKLLPFTRGDITFLKELQDDTIEYVEFLLRKHAKRLKRDEDRANEMSRIEDKKGMVAVRQLSIEDLNQIDHYHDYHFKYIGEKKRDK